MGRLEERKSADQEKDKPKDSMINTLAYGVIILLLVGILGKGGNANDQEYAKYKAYVQQNTVEVDYDKLEKYADSHDNIAPDDSNTIPGTPDTNNQVFCNSDFIHDNGYLDKQVEMAKQNDDDNSTVWTITVNTENYRFTVLRKAPDGQWKPLCAFYCGIGEDTKKGIFTVQRKYAEYGGELFVTIYYDNGEQTQSINNLFLGYGGRYTDGDVVLDERSAHFIYDNIPEGTKVIIY